MTFGDECWCSPHLTGEETEGSKVHHLLKFTNWSKDFWSVALELWVYANAGLWFWRSIEKLALGGEFFWIFKGHFKNWRRFHLTLDINYVGNLLWPLLLENWIWGLELCGSVSKRGPGTGFWFPTPMFDGSQLTVTQAPGHLIPSSGLLEHLHSSVHTHIDKHMYT